MAILNLFGKPNAPSDTILKSNKPTAIAFVDYEHWYISMDRMYGTKPDIRRWKNELSEKYDVTDILFFADFSNQSLRAEIQRIREITSYIIETQSASQYHKKDYTDFILLDHIYQRALTSPNTDVFIIFSGDGHFSSVASFLVNRCGKKVVVYGIKNAFAAQLQNTATEAIEWPREDEIAAIEEGNKASNKEDNNNRRTDAKRNIRAESANIRNVRKASDDIDNSKNIIKSEKNTAVNEKSVKRVRNASEQNVKNESKKQNKAENRRSVSYSGSKSNADEKTKVKVPSKSAASEVTSNPKAKEKLHENCKYIVKNMSYLEKGNVGSKKIEQTFDGTVESVSDYYKLKRSDVIEALNQLCDLGYVKADKQKNGKIKGSSSIEADWEKINKTQIN